MTNIKPKGYIAGSIFLCFVLFLVGVQNAGATTFPVDKAGIAAYVKLDSVDITDLTEALNYFHSIEKQDETYVIGTVKVGNEIGRWTNYPHVYIGLDGWIIAYYLNTEEASRIMQWKDYSAGTIKTTTLQDAIDIMSANIGVTYSTPIKYYDFEFPDANRLTLIAETFLYSNSFSVTIPGTLYEGSYFLYTGTNYCPLFGPCSDYPIYLSVDGISVFQSPASSWTSYYGYYNISTLAVSMPHFISVSRYNGGGAATVLIYKS